MFNLEITLKDKIYLGILVLAFVFSIGLVGAFIEKQINRSNESSYQVQIENLRADIKLLKDTRPTFDEVDTLVANGMGVVYVEREQVEKQFDKQPNVDLSQPPKKDKITYRDNATGRIVEASDATCGINENRLHWEMFAMPAPGCENTPYKGM